MAHMSIASPRSVSHGGRELGHLLAKLDGMSAPDRDFDLVELDQAIGDLVREWLVHSGRAADSEVLLLAAIHVCARAKVRRK
jgi:hypothetical protein